MNLRKAQQGVSLIEALISILIMSFGILGLAHFQAAQLAATTEYKARNMVDAAVKELTALVRVDAANVGCYLYPVAGACTSAPSKAYTTNWAKELTTQVPSVSEIIVEQAGGTQIRVRVTYTLRADSAVRTQEVLTDVSI